MIDADEARAIASQIAAGADPDGQEYRLARWVLAHAAPRQPEDQRCATCAHCMGAAGCARIPVVRHTTLDSIPPGEARVEASKFAVFNPSSTFGCVLWTSM